MPTSSSDADAAVELGGPVGRLGDARQDLEQRALAGAVAADDADDLAARDARTRRRAAPRCGRAVRCGATPSPRTSDRSCGVASDIVSRSEPYRNAPRGRRQAGSACRALNRRRGWPVDMRQMTSANVSSVRGSKRGRRRAAVRTTTSDARQERHGACAAEKRPAESLDHAGHRVEGVQHAPAVVGHER